MREVNVKRELNGLPGHRFSEVIQTRVHPQVLSNPLKSLNVFQLYQDWQGTDLRTLQAGFCLAVLELVEFHKTWSADSAPSKSLPSHLWKVVRHGTLAKTFWFRRSGVNFKNFNFLGDPDIRYPVLHHPDHWNKLWLGIRPKQSQLVSSLGL